MHGRRFCILLLLLSWALLPAHAQLRGHGGPVRALAVSPDGKRLASASFDTTAITWSLTSGAAERVMRFHEGAANAVVFLPDGRVATSGEDARIAIWRAGDDKPVTILQGHTAPVVSLAVSPDGKTLASASWDNTARLWPLGGGTPRVLEGHQQNVNGIAFTPDRRSVVTVGYDLTLRIWPLADGGSPTIMTLPTPLNSVVVAVNAQPTFRPTATGGIALGHNGNLTNTLELQSWLTERDATDGSLVPGALSHEATNDTSLITALLATYPGLTIEEAAREVLPHLKGAFSLVFMDEETLYAARDPQGIRPLVLGRLERGWVVASETAALDIVGASYVRESSPAS